MLTGRYIENIHIYPLKGPSTQIVGFQGPKTIQGMDFGTSNLGYSAPLGICVNMHVASTHACTRVYASEKCPILVGALCK